MEWKDSEEAVQEEAKAVAAWQEQDSIPAGGRHPLPREQQGADLRHTEETRQQLHALEDPLVCIGLDC